MTQSEAINKLAIECHSLVEQYPDAKYATIRKYIQMALVVGLEHFSTNMDEVVALDHNGVELGIFKSTQEASEKLGVYRKNITAVLGGRRPSAGGYRFIKRKDYKLLRRSSEKINP